MVLAHGTSITWFDLTGLLSLIFLKKAGLKVCSSWHLERDTEVLLLPATLFGTMTSSWRISVGGDTGVTPPYWFYVKCLRTPQPVLVEQGEKLLWLPGQPGRENPAQIPKSRPGSFTCTTTAIFITSFCGTASFQTLSFLFPSAFFFSYRGSDQTWRAPAVWY